MKHKPTQLLGAALTALTLLAGGQAKAGLLGYWNFDGPPSATTSERLKDLSGNSYHGNDRNYGGGTGANRVLFNNADVPQAPFLTAPGGANYSLDLSGADRYVVMEGVTGIAAPGAVTSRGNIFNIGSVVYPATTTNGKLTVSFWFKGLPSQSWGNFVAKGGESYGTAGLPTQWEGWAVRRGGANNNMAFTTRNFGALGGNGDGDVGVNDIAKSGPILAAPTITAGTPRRA